MFARGGIVKDVSLLQNRINKFVRLGGIMVLVTDMRVVADSSPGFSLSHTDYVCA